MGHQAKQLEYKRKRFGAWEDYQQGSRMLDKATLSQLRRILLEFREVCKYFVWALVQEDYWQGISVEQSLERSVHVLQGTSLSLGLMFIAKF